MQAALSTLECLSILERLSFRVEPPRRLRSDWTGLFFEGHKESVHQGMLTEADIGELASVLLHQHLLLDLDLGAGRMSVHGACALALPLSLIHI